MRKAEILNFQLNKMFRKIYIVLSFVFIVVCGCKSNKETVVNVQPEFSADQVWVLTEMRGKEFVLAEGQKKVTLLINPETGVASGTNGCNRFFARVKMDGMSKISFGDFNGTKMACPEAFHKTERNFMQAIEHCDEYRLGEYTLELLQNGRVVLAFEKEKP